MTTPPDPPPTELPTAFRAELRALIHAQPTPELRSSTIYNIVRECYDAVRAIHGPAADTEERSSVGDVSTAALGHEDAMYRLAGLVAVPETSGAAPTPRTSEPDPISSAKHPVQDHSSYRYPGIASGRPTSR